MLFLPRLSLLALIFVLNGCDNSEIKTESMIYRENAIKEAQEPIKKAQVLLTQDVIQHPAQHLDTLIIIQGALKDARKIYRTKNIDNADDETLISVTYTVEAFEPELTNHAFELLHQLVDRTQLLRKQIEEVKTRPASALERSPDKMVEFLSQRYNREIADCCLGDLGQVDHLLTNNVKKHRELIVMIRSMNLKLEQMIREEDYGEALRQEIDSLRNSYAR